MGDPILSPLRLKAAGGASGLYDPAMMRRALALFCDPNHSVELRASYAAQPKDFWRSRVRSGIDLDALVADALSLSGGAKGVYFCINPVATFPGEHKPSKMDDVKGRRWLFLDFDPIRPKGSNATEGEKSLAATVCGRVMAHLKGEGWPEPVLCDSGNGWHLYYRVELPVSNEAQALLRNGIRALRARFNTPAVDIDQGVHRAAQLGKLPGTWARKGPHSEDRPHRPSLLVEVPQDVQVVPEDKLEALGAAAKPPPPPPSSNGHAPANPLRLKAGGGADDANRRWALQALRNICAEMEVAGPNTLNTTLNRVAFRAGQLVAGGGITDVEAETQVMAAAARAGCDNPAKDQDTFRRGLDAGKAEPARVPEAGPPPRSPAVPAAPPPPPAPPPPVPPASPWRPFSLSALPPVIADLAREGASAMNCDPAYVALPALAVAAAAIGNSRSVMLKRSWTEHPILWTTTVGESGQTKSPPVRLALKPLYKGQRAARDRHQHDRAEWEEEREAWRERCRAARAAGNDPPSCPQRPAEGRKFCSDVTIEKLAELLEDNPRGLLVARDELSAWFNGFSRYKAKGAGSDVPNWLELYQAGNVTIDRKTGGRPSLIIERASVSVTGSIQPGILARALTPEAMESGLAARLLLAWPPRRLKVWKDADVSEALEQEWESLVSSLQGLTMRQKSESDADRVPHRLPLTPEAKALWVEWYDSWGQTQFAASDEIAPTYAKIEAVAARLALVHAVCCAVAFGEDALSPVCAESMASGIALARWFGQEAERCYATLRRTAADRDRDRLVEWIQLRGGSVSVRDLHRARFQDRGGVEAARACLKSLADAGLGTLSLTKPGPEGGRPQEVFALVLTKDRTDRTDETDETYPEDT